VARRLADLEVAQRLVVRDPGRAPRLPGAEVAQASYEDAEAMLAALDGIRTLLLVSGHEAFARVPQHRRAVDAAVAAGVERIVYTSFLASASDATFTFSHDHAATEEYVRGSGLAWTFLRPSLYLDLVPYFAWDDGVIRAPAGDGRIAWVARDDVADVAIAVLTGTDHEHRTYDVTGPQLLTLEATARILTGVTGREIRYVPETLEEARASRASADATAEEIEGWATSYYAIATGEMAVVSDTVERLTGHQPAALEPYLRTHPELWSHLVLKPR